MPPSTMGDLLTQITTDETQEAADSAKVTADQAQLATDQAAVTTDTTQLASDQATFAADLALTGPGAVVLGDSVVIYSSAPNAPGYSTVTYPLLTSMGIPSPPAPSPAPSN
jgi:hypothetical protein